MNELSLFAGSGGGILGGKLLGWRTVCAVEHDAYCAAVLAQRQNDGIIPPFPIWSDIESFDGRPWKGIVEVISGGFPCQDISVAGRGAGIDGKRSGLWKEMARIIGEIRPRFVFVENSPALIKRGLIRILGDLAKIGYDARWGIMGADDVGAPHVRKRIWLVGSIQDAIEWQVNSEKKPREIPNSHGSGCQEQRIEIAKGTEHKTTKRSSWWSAEPDVGRMANGMANRVDRLAALGNGQVPGVVRRAWRQLGISLLK